MLKKDHRRHIADQFNFHPKESIVILIQMYFKEKAQYFISDYFSFMETHEICYGAVLKIVIWHCGRKLL